MLLIQTQQPLYYKSRSVVLLSMARREVITVASQSPVQVMSTAMAWMI
jgi:hypothetical protein